MDTKGESPPSALTELTLIRGKLGGLQVGGWETNKQVHKQRKQFPPRGSRGQEASAPGSCRISLGGEICMVGGGGGGGDIKCKGPEVETCNLQLWNLLSIRCTIWDMISEPEEQGLT